MARLLRSFYDRNSVTVARALLGQRLVRVLEGERLGGLISETEAYTGQDDAASHAYRQTPRSAIMFGPPGYAYVYFIYGMYFCLNATTEGEGCPGAVLIRAILPDEGAAVMRDRRLSNRGRARDHRPDGRLTDGPGKLCQALGITRELNGADLTTGHELLIEASDAVPDSEVDVSARVGVRGDAAARARPWRFVWRVGDTLTKDGHGDGHSGPACTTA